MTILAIGQVDPGKSGQSLPELYLLYLYSSCIGIATMAIGWVDRGRRRAYNSE